MSTSGGGGYCDCGDPEAWKTEPFCSIHRPENKDLDESKVNFEQLVLYSKLPVYKMTVLR